MARYIKYKDESDNNLFSADLSVLNFTPYVPGVGVHIKHDNFNGTVVAVDFDATSHLITDNYDEVVITIKLDEKPLTRQEKAAITKAEKEVK